MTTISKNVIKGLPVNIKVRKPRHYYQDIVGKYGTDVVKNVDIVPFEGLETETDNKFFTVKGGSLWNYTRQVTTTKLLAPFIDGQKLFTPMPASLEYTLVGSPTISNGVLSGITGSKYVKVPEPFLPGNSPWEIVFKVTTPSSWSQQRFFGSSTNYYRTVGGEFSASGVFGVGLTSGGSTWDIAWKNFTTACQTNTTYWIRLRFTGTQYTGELSTDGIDYNLEFTHDSTKILYQADTSIMCIGYMGSETGKYFKGTVDLNECYIKIDDTVFWGKGKVKLEEHEGCLESSDTVERKEYNIFTRSLDSAFILRNSDEDFDDEFIWAGKTVVPAHDKVEAYLTDYSVVGSLSLKPNWLIKGFSNVNYISVPALPEGYTNYEMVFVGSVPSTTNGNVLITDTSGERNLIISKSGIVAINGSIQAASTSGTIPLNTYYIFKLVWDGEKSTVYSAPHPGPYKKLFFPYTPNWKEECTLSEDIFATTTSTLKVGGSIQYDTYYWRGDFLLNRCYIKVDGEYFWEPVKEV